MRNRQNDRIGFYIVILILIVAALRFLNVDSINKTIEKEYTTLITDIKEENVKTLRKEDYKMYVKTKDDKVYETYIPESMMAGFYDDYLKEPVENGDINITFVPKVDRTFEREVIIAIITMVGFGLLMLFVLRAMQGGNKDATNFGKAKIKLYEEDNKEKITFNDVAGLHEEKEELFELVDFLKNPKKFDEVGARIPTGVLMVGPPGTGKTYLSRAVAGEAGVPFFSISGSDFVEMFVGVGASRVRDLFENAKKQAPAIIFIDEIDAVGRRRGAGLGGGHDEREQTLNQLLVEMDGFSKNEGLIIMAATNRADILDPALLRPGRFDRTVYVGMPDLKGREEILKVHTRNKPIDPSVDLKTIAKRTPGFSPADLENMINEAALLTARSNRKTITDADIHEASIKVQAGPAKKSKIVSDRDRKITAVHEAGHAIVSRMIPYGDKVDLITIVPRGRAGGFTAFLPEDDNEFITKSYLESEIIGLLGGRSAEEIVLGEISTGASNDIERATKIAKAMVETFGMSDELGVIKYGEDNDNVFVGMDVGRGKDHSDEVQAKIDKEVHRIISEAHEKCRELIRENLDVLNALSDLLLEKETISGAEFENLFTKMKGISVEEASEEATEKLDLDDDVEDDSSRENL